MLENGVGRLISSLAPMGPPAPSPIRFGPFEFNTRCGELLRHGLKVRLPHQPFQVLALLLEHPGEVVTRGGLRKRLWPDDIVVDFDHGLNKAVNGLRAALRDARAGEVGATGAGRAPPASLPPSANRRHYDH